MKRIIFLAILIITLALPSYGFCWSFPGIPSSSSSGSGDISTDTIWDAAGDTVYGTGSNTASRLAKGTAYQLYMMNSGATAPAWTSTLGATGTRLTKGWFTDLEITNMPSVNGTAIDSTFMPIGWISRAGTNNVLTYTGNYSLGITLSGNTDVTMPTSGTLATTAAIPTAASLHMDDILTALGIASEATHFGTFTGSTIADSQTAKAAIQALETAVEGKQADLSLVKGTYTDTYLCKYTASGTLLDCNVDPAGFQTAITFGVGTETALASAPDASGGFLSVGGLGSVTQAYSAILDGIAGVTPANNGIFGYNDSGDLGLYTNHSHDDSAAHYFNVADSTKTFQYDLQYMTTGKKITYQPTAADNYSYKVTITGNTDVTMPTSGTILSSGVATGGLIFGDSSPDTEGEFGYASNQVSVHDGTASRPLLQVASTTITKSEYMPVRYAEDDDSVTAPAAAAEIGTTTAIARSFAEDADNGLVFWWQIPIDYSAGIKFRVYFATDTNAGADETAVFNLSGCAMASSGALACSEGTGQEAVLELTADEDTGELLVSGWSAGITIGGSPAAGQMAKLLLIRDVTGGGTEDDMVGHALITGIEVKYQAKVNASGDY